MKKVIFFFFCFFFFNLKNGCSIFTDDEMQNENFLEPNHHFSMPIVADLNVYDVDISSSFNGLDILLFIVKNNSNDFAGNIIGPPKKYLIAKREKIFGLWLKKKVLVFEDAPSYYSFWIFDENNDLDHDLLDFYKIGFDSLRFQVGNQANLTQEEILEFRKAFFEYMKKRKLYSGPHHVVRTNNNLLRISSFVPDQTSVGNYFINIFSFKENNAFEIDGEVKMNFFVKHLNFNKFLSNLNNNYSKTYTLFLILMAILNIFVIRLITIKDK
jgi:hypothetical protein